MMLQIGSLNIPSALALAPLSGISDLAFRMINRSFGCEFAFTEMVSAKSLVYESRKESPLLASGPGDSPLGVQLIGNDVDIIRRALDVVVPRGFDVIDFNAACPVAKVVKKGEGAAILKEPHRLEAILRVLSRSAPVPVTVKIRSGWDDSCVNAVDIARRAEDAGVQAVFLHGRTRMQGYSGTVDYRIIRQVKQALSIPVVASGDALSPQLIKKQFDETGCDGVIIARGALGNPWIFSQAKAFLANDPEPAPPSTEEVFRVMRHHIDLLCALRGESKAVTLFRKFFAWYTRGIAHVRPLRNQAFRVHSKEELLCVMERLRAGHADVVTGDQGSIADETVIQHSEEG